MARQRESRQLLIHLDRSAGVRLGRQLEDQLRDGIRSGRLAPESQLPSTRALAEDLGVSRGVVVRAYAQLAAEGYLDIRQGANPYVRSIPRSAVRAEGVAVPPAQRVLYDLRPGLVEVNTFPRQGWLRSLRTALASATNAELGYSDARGLEQLRSEVAGYLGRARGVVADPDRIVITTGSINALSLICRALAREGKTRMAFENPSHERYRAIAARSGQTPVAVPLDGEGLCTDALPAMGADSVYVSPSHQFPTGVVLSPQRRASLIGWARTTESLVVEDDYDAEFRFDRAPVGALQGLSPDHVAYIGSADRTFAPAIRIGWAVLPSSFSAAVARELGDSMLHVAGIQQLALADFLRRGDLDRHVRKMRAIYRRRREAVIAEVRERLPAFHISGIPAGLYVVAEMPPELSESAVCERAAALGVHVRPVGRYAMEGYGGPPALVIGYGAVSEPAIPHAIALLAQAVDAELHPRAAAA